MESTIIQLDLETLSFVLFLVGQTVCIVWWAATLTGKVKSLKEWQGKHENISAEVASLREAISGMKTAVETLNSTVARLDQHLLKRGGI